MTDRRTFIAQTAGALAAVAIAPEAVLAPPRRRGEPKKLALAGIGRQGRDILDELRKLDAVQVAAVYDVVPTRVRAGLERAAGAAGFDDYRRLLEERTDIEGVVVATPTHLHRQIVEAALQAGRHVYCEAPLAAAEDDVRAIAAAAAASGRVFQAGLLARSNPIYRRARLLVRSDSIRGVVSLDAQHHRKTSWRVPAPDRSLERAFNWRLDPDVSIGLPGELGTHQFDVFTWLRGRPPARVEGSGSIRLHDDGRAIPDTVQLRLYWDDGVVLSYQATLANSYGGAYEVLYGTHGAVRLAGTHGWFFKETDSPTQGWEVYATRQRLGDDEGIVLVADATRLAAQGRLQDGAGLEYPPLYYALADFARSIIEGGAPAATAEDGLRATPAGIAAHRAVMQGGVVEVGAPA